MKPSRWQSFATPSTGREYLAMASSLPLKQYATIPRFLRFTAAIRGQLGRAPGLLGYSLQAEFRARRFWTLSVWEDEAALMRFVNEPPHERVMGMLATRMDPTKFARWMVTAAAVPPGWDDAKRRLREA
jgi:heme-degrading monooxygenase HmoA